MFKTNTVGSFDDGEPATDVWAVSCAEGAIEAEASVSDVPPARKPLVSIQLVDGKSASPLSTDFKDGDKKFSEPVKLARGVGPYSIHVNRQWGTWHGAEMYTFKLTCLDANGANVDVISAEIEQDQ